MESRCWSFLSFKPDFAEFDKFDKSIKKRPWTFGFTVFSALAHFACFIAAIVLAAKRTDKSTSTYTFYMPTFVSSRSPEKATNVSFAQEIQAQLNQTCPKQQWKIQTMEAEFNAAHVRGTWLPVEFSFGGVKVHGYGLIIAISAISFISQLKVFLEMFLGNDDFFREPCSARWFEYSLTSSLMIVILASCLMIRDIFIVSMLSVTQGALAQLGYAVEVAFSLKSLVPPPDDALDALDATNDSAGTLAISFLPELFAPNIPWYTHAIRVLPRLCQKLWYWSMVPACLLHAAVWSVLSLAWIQQTKVCVQTNPQSGTETEMPKWLVYILVVQGILFTSFACVSVRQALRLSFLPGQAKINRVEPEDLGNSFESAFVMYSFLSVVSKTVLAGVFLVYVETFPFGATKNT
jgi:hypothetical protein